MTTYKAALKEALRYFKNDELPAEVYLGKYALKTPNNDILEKTPDQMHRRLAKEFARIEKKHPNPLSEEEIYEYLKDFSKIIPQGSPMAGVGNPYQIMSLSNCFVIDSPADSYGGILKADQEEAQLMKRRGGVGFDISTIRPKGIGTKNAAKTTDGIAVFMDRFSNTCREVAQGGRRGALMLTISVHHPEIATFVKIKNNRKRVTGANISIRLSDEFMQAVKDGTDYEVRWPVDSKNPSIVDKINAKELWDEINESAHGHAEPGLLFWDTVKRESPADAYESVGFGTVSTNPCFSGDTLIATADGRNAVTIKQLAEEGKDVPVYSVNPETGLIEIKTGRNPRITGYEQKLLRIRLDDGSYLDVTPNHKMLLRDGTGKLACELVKGDSLPRFKKSKQKPNKTSQDYWQVNCNTRNALDSRVFEHKLISQFNEPEKWASIKINEQNQAWSKGGLVVHHKDYNGLNNSPDNLEVMTWKEHQQFHAEHDTSGRKNGKYLGSSSEDILNHGLKLTKKLSRRFSHKEWQTYAKKNKLPQTFSKMHHVTLGKSPAELSKMCAAQLGFNKCSDPRLIKSLQSMIKQGYDAEIVNSQVVVKKTCETCKSDFAIAHDRREISFCSHACSLVYVNSNKKVASKRIKSRNIVVKQHAEESCEAQAKIYSQLKFDLKRKPLMKEWEVACKNENIPCRIGKTMKYGFKNYEEVVEAGDNYNHKVVSVEELPGLHTVYNVTVDDYHTVSTITNTTNTSQLGVITYNCGEITLSPYDSCRLLVVNTLDFVDNPFEKNASFNYKRFTEVAGVAQRLMDDIIDLEIECIDKILTKIEADPESEDVKFLERRLWEKIKDSAERGRRTGTGVTAIGDTLAALGIKYGSKESIDAVEEIYKHLALGTYRSSVQMAKERGAFPAYDYELEKDHKFIKKIVSLDPKLLVDWKKYGRRNIANTTTAPCGSVSVLTQTTSGIEPAFMLWYMRRKKINPNDKGARVDFVDDLGDSWQEYKVYHHGFKKWMEVTGLSDPSESPYFGATANEIDWVSKVSLQAAAQQWVCHSISNTTNLPKDTPIEVVKDIYMTGWESGCKGVTIYREGCRDGVLLAESDEKKATDEIDLENKSRDLFMEHHAPTRPSSLNCDIFHMTVHGEKWNMFVGLFDGRPYEIFAGRAEFVDIPKSKKEGIIKKNGVYNLYYGDKEDPTVIKDLAKVFENSTESAFTRTVSLTLRHGTPVQYVVEQLEKGADKDSNMFSLAKALMRVLKKYINDGTKPSQKKCENCSGTDLAYQEGCVTCAGCGASKCS